MSIRERMSGNEAIAIAMRQINPDVVPAFPITPSTEIPQYFSQYVADGSVDSEFIPVESEHSAMSAAMGSQAAGARTMTATSSCGLALMWEMLYVVSSARLPVTLACVNRALTGPININADHSDSLGARDAGWIQLYSETNHPEDYLLNAKRPTAVGPYDIVSYYMEHKVSQAHAMMNAKKVILEVAAEYEKLTGRKYGLFEEYKLDDAEVAIVVINSTAGTAKAAIEEMRKEGKKVGLLKIRVFRPFPMEEIAQALKNVKMVAVMDKCEGFSAVGGPVFAEVRSALYDCSPRPKMINYVYGLGGRDITVNHIKEIFNTLLAEKDQEVKDTYRHFGVRG